MLSSYGEGSWFWSSSSCWRKYSFLTISLGKIKARQPQQKLALLFWYSLSRHLAQYSFMQHHSTLSMSATAHSAQFNSLRPSAWHPLCGIHSKHRVRLQILVNWHAVIKQVAATSSHKSLCNIFLNLLHAIFSHSSQCIVGIQSSKTSYKKEYSQVHIHDRRGACNRNKWRVAIVVSHLPHPIQQHCTSSIKQKDCSNMCCTWPRTDRGLDFVPRAISLEAEHALMSFQKYRQDCRGWGWQRSWKWLILESNQDLHACQQG